MEVKDEIKNRIDLVDFIGQSVKLKRSGRNFSGLCPFHQEKSPSFFVSAERQFFKCFGCGESGDLFTFYMKREGVTFPEAIKDLAIKAGVDLKDYQAPQDFLQKQQLLEINQLALRFYQYLLLEHKLGEPALAYLKSRGVGKTQIKEFSLGFAPEAWDNLTNFLTAKKRYKAEIVEKTGLILKGNYKYYDRFRGRVMFPLIDIRDNVIGFSGMILPQFDDGKTGKYINSPETALYHKSSHLFPLQISKEYIRKENQVIIVEGEFDVMASFRIGVKNVVAVKGSALTLEQVRLLKRFADTIVLSLDADEAGIKSAKRAIEVCQNEEVNVKVIRVKNGKDPDELVKTDPSFWKKLTKTPIDIYEFFLEIALTHFNPKTVEGKQAITKDLIPVFLQIQNKVIQDHYLHKLSEILEVSKDVLLSEMQRVEKKQELNLNFKKEELVKEKGHKSRIELLGEELLAMVLQFYDDIDWELVNFNHLPSNASIKILQKLNRAKPKDLVSFAQKLPPELQQQFDEAYLQEFSNWNKNQLNKELQKVLSSLAKLYLNDKLKDLRQALRCQDKDKVSQEINLVLQALKAYN
ncbi:DNA primase [Candidatus Beckwithbacteria bacterium]|nr:DNA primase [Candidatus Beckwithbacteria bacterium]